MNLWETWIPVDPPFWPTTPIATRCDVCGRKDETVVVVLIIRDYDPLAKNVDIPPQNCPKMCADCREDEPTSESLARRMIG